MREKRKGGEGPATEKKKKGGDRHPCQEAGDIPSWEKFLSSKKKLRIPPCLAESVKREKGKNSREGRERKKGVLDVPGVDRAD